MKPASGFNILYSNESLFSSLNFLSGSRNTFFPLEKETVSPSRLIQIPSGRSIWPKACPLFKRELTESMCEKLIRLKFPFISAIAFLIILLRAAICNSLIEEIERVTELFSAVKTDLLNMGFIKSSIHSSSDLIIDAKRLIVSTILLL